MQPSVTLDDGVESVLLDRATGLDVRGAGFELVDDIRAAVVHAFPRAAFDRWFLAAIAREAERRPTCQSARLLHDTGLAAWMARVALAGLSAAAMEPGGPGRHLAPDDDRLEVLAGHDHRAVVGPVETGDELEQVRLEGRSPGIADGVERLHRRAVEAPPVGQVACGER